MTMEGSADTDKTSKYVLSRVAYEYKYTFTYENTSISGYVLQSTSIKTFLWFENIYALLYKVYS